MHHLNLYVAIATIMRGDFFSIWNVHNRWKWKCGQIYVRLFVIFLQNSTWINPNTNPTYMSLSFMNFVLSLLNYNNGMYRDPSVVWKPLS